MKANIHPQALFQFVAGALGNQINDAARRAEAVDGIGTVQHFHALQHQRRNSMAVAAATAKGVGLGNAINQVQGFAAAQAFPGAGHFLARG